MSPQTTLAELQASSKGFAGGVNIRDNFSELAANQCRRMENVVLDEAGAARARMGMEFWSNAGSGTNTVISMYVFYRGTLTPIVLTHHSNGTLWQKPITTSGLPAGGDTQIASGLSAIVPLTFETYNGKCYMSNSVDGYMSYDGTTYATYPAVPRFSLLRVWRDTMWGAFGNDRIYASAAGDPETWPIANWVDLSKGDGDMHTALATDGTYLLAFKRDRYVTIYDPATFANRTIDFEKGCESHFSVISFEGEIYFLSRRGICRYQGVDTPAVIVSGLLDPLFDPQILNYDALNLACAYTINNRVGWCLPEAGNTSPNFQVEYYPRMGGINSYGIRSVGPFCFHRMPVSFMRTLRVGGTSRLLASEKDQRSLFNAFAIDPSLGLIDQGHSGGVGIMIPYDAVIETGAYSFGQVLNDKYLRRMRLLASGEIIVRIRTNFGTTIEKTIVADLTSSLKLWNDGNWDVGTWGPDELYQLPRLDLDLYGKFFTFEFRATIANAVGHINTSDIGRREVMVGSIARTVDDAAFAIYNFFIEAKSVGVR